MTKKTKEKTTPKAPKKSTHRQWLYKGEEGKIFKEGESIPAGYTDAPKAK